MKWISVKDRLPRCHELVVVLAPALAIISPERFMTNKNGKEILMCFFATYTCGNKEWRLQHSTYDPSKGDRGASFFGFDTIKWWLPLPEKPTDTE